MIVATIPSFAAPETESRFSASFGYVGSTVEVDVERAGKESIVLDGWGVSGRVYLDDRWALQARWSVVEDDRTAGSVTLDRIDLLALRQWVSPSSRHRLYFTFGATRLTVEERTSLAGTVEDDVTGPAVGVGWEWGGSRWALAVDFAGSVVDVESAFGDESWIAGTTITGVSYRF